MTVPSCMFSLETCRLQLCFLARKKLQVLLQNVSISIFFYALILIFFSVVDLEAEGPAGEEEHEDEGSEEPTQADADFLNDGEIVVEKSSTPDKVDG